MDPNPDQPTYVVEAVIRQGRLGAALVDGLMSFAPLGIRRTTCDGDTPSIWRVFFLHVVFAAVMQLVLKIQGIGNLIHLVGVVFIFKPTRNRLHDLFANTHMVKA